MLTPLSSSVIMIVFQCAIGSIRKDRVSSEKLRFRPLFMRPNANRTVFAGRFSGKPQGLWAERFEITMVAADHVNFRGLR